MTGRSWPLTASTPCATANAGLHSYPGRTVSPTAPTASTAPTTPYRSPNFDFRAGKCLGDQKLDTPFTDLDRDQDGRAWARLTAPDGSRTELWVHEHYPIIEIYTADTLSPPRRRVGPGAEPMSCPPNALRTGNGLTRLEPGHSLTTTWGVRMTHQSVDRRRLVT